MVLEELSDLVSGKDDVEQAFDQIELTKAIDTFLDSLSPMSYRTRVRTPSFAHLQQIPAAIRGSLVSDLIVYLGSIDFVMSDVDR